MDDIVAAQTARQLFKANRARERYAPLPDAVRAMPLTAAYEVQSHYNTLQVEGGSGQAVGYKIALTSKAMQALVHVGEPLAGVIYASRMHQSPAQLSLAKYQHVGVEFEVTVRLGADLSPGAAPHTRMSVADAIATCAASYELIEDRNADYTQINAFNLVAENAWNTGLIMGAEHPGIGGIDMLNAPTRLWINSKPAGEGRTGDALGHPLEAVAWLANLLNSQGKVLERDMLIMTGSSITTKFPAAGEHYRFEIEGLEPVAIEWFD